MPDEKSFHMTPDEFRRHGHAVVDWIADYHSRIESFPVLSQAKPGEIRASLPANPPAQGEPFETLLKDVEKVILPGVTHWQSPNFFAYFPCNGFRSRHSRRSSLFWTRSAGHALVDESRLHRTGNACARLARAHARSAGEIPVVEHWRRSYSRYRFERRCCARCWPPANAPLTTLAIRKDATGALWLMRPRRRIRRCKRLR